MSRELRIEVTVRPGSARRALAAFLLLFAPIELGSQTMMTESVTMNVTYPAPTSAYIRLITTGKGSTSDFRKISSYLSR